MNLAYKMAWIASELSLHKFPLSRESDTQKEIEKVFERMKIPFKREVKLGERDRVDFLVFDEIGVEVKVGGSRANTARQLKRYELSDKINGLILVTSKAYNSGEPIKKPFKVVDLARAWL